MWIYPLYTHPYCMGEGDSTSSNITPGKCGFILPILIFVESEIYLGHPEASVHFAPFVSKEARRRPNQAGM